MDNPFIGEKKRFNIKDQYVVKVNKQRIVILYHIDEDNCRVVVDNIGPHDGVYKNTF